MASKKGTGVFVFGLFLVGWVWVCSLTRKPAEFVHTCRCEVPLRHHWEMSLEHCSYLGLWNDQGIGFQKEMSKTICFMEERLEFVFTFILKISSFKFIYYVLIINKFAFIIYKETNRYNMESVQIFFYLRRCIKKTWDHIDLSCESRWEIPEKTFFKKAAKVKKIAWIIL